MRTKFRIVDLRFSAASPLAVGSNVDAANDSDPRNADETMIRHAARTGGGEFVLPATGIAGALAELGRRIGFTDAESTVLFGAVVERATPTADDPSSADPDHRTEGDDEDALQQASTVSRLDISDGRLVNDTWEKRLRTRTVVDRATGGGADRLLFTIEEISPRVGGGKEADGEVEVRIEFDLSGDDDGSALKLFERLLSGLVDHGLVVGAGTRSGAGQLAVEKLLIQEVDLSELDHLETLAAIGVGELFPVNPPFREVTFSHAACDEIDEETEPSPGESRKLPRAFDGFRFELVVRPTEPYGSTLPAGRPSSTSEVGAARANVIEMEHVAGGAGLRGSAVRGALRSRAERIVRSRGTAVWDVVHATGRSGDVRQFDPATRAFGSTNRASTVIVNDTLRSDEITSDQQLFHHVSIDRFTGGAADDHLFSVRAHCGGELTLVVDVEHRGDDRDFASTCGLVLLVLLDVATGDLPLGGLTTRGYGTFHGTQLRVTASTGSGVDTWRKSVREAIGAVIPEDPGTWASPAGGSQGQEPPGRQEFLPSPGEVWRNVLDGCVRCFNTAGKSASGEVG